jgi:hypothetical protein
VAALWAGLDDGVGVAMLEGEKQGRGSNLKLGAMRRKRQLPNERMEILYNVSISLIATDAVDNLIFYFQKADRIL